MALALQALLTEAKKAHEGKLRRRCGNVLFLLVATAGSEQVIVEVDDEDEEEEELSSDVVEGAGIGPVSKRWPRCWWTSSRGLCRSR